MARSFISAAAVSAALLVAIPAAAQTQQIEKKGTTPYVTHFVFRPVQSFDVKGAGTVNLLEAVGTTQNMNGESMLDKM